jgi:hypothetical protein
MRREIILDAKGSELFREELEKLLELLQVHVYVPIDNIKTIIEADFYEKGRSFPGAEKDEKLAIDSIINHYDNAKKAIHEVELLLDIMSKKAERYRANNAALNNLLDSIFVDIRDIEDSLWSAMKTFENYPYGGIERLYKASVKSLETLDRMRDELVEAMNRGIFM